VVTTSSPQLDLLEYAAQEALRQRDLGIDRVLYASDTEYRDRLLGAIEILAIHGDPFTADDARAIAGDPPADVHPNLAGAVFNAAAKAGIIRFVGEYALSTRVIGHRNLIRVWKGVQS